jgi:hypothetical protein
MNTNSVNTVSISQNFTNKGNLARSITGDEEKKINKNSGVYQSLAIDSSGRRTDKTDDSP